MKKVIPVIIAIVLIIVIAAAGLGVKLLDKYSYSLGLREVMMCL